MKGKKKKGFARGLKYVFLIVSLVGVLSGLKLGTHIVNVAAIELTPWNFYQTGTTTSAWNSGEKCAFSSVVAVNGETLTSDDFPLEVWDEETGAYVATDITKTLSGITDGFDAEILSNGWSIDYNHGTSSINPYTVTAYMDNIKMEDRHSYTITFTARATSKKYIYISIRNNYFATVAYKIIVLDTTPHTYSLTFKNNASNAYLQVKLMMGAFNATHDYGGNDISDIINPLETNWSGTVSISNFVLEDTTSNDIQTTTSQVTATTTAAAKVTRPAKVKSLKIIRKKGNRVSLMWKKLKKANGYQIVYARNKKFTKSKKQVIIKKAAKTTRIIRKLKKGKTYYFKVRAYKNVNGKKLYGDFSKVKKIKMK